MYNCKYCDAELTFDSEYVSERTGKKIPLDVDTGEPHDCPENPYHGNNNNRLLECWTCGEQITFSDKMVSKKSGKKIPLDPKTMKPHNCPDPLSSENEEGGGG